MLLKHTKQLRLLRADLERDLQELAPSAPGGGREDERISIAINADSIATWALGALHDLVHQRLPLEIIVDDQDFTQEWLRSGQVLGCVTTLKQALRGCKMVPLGAMRYVAVASPTFAQKHLPGGLTAHNFRTVPYLSFNRKDDMAVEFVARAFGLKRVALNHLFVPSSEGQMRAVAARQAGRRQPGGHGPVPGAAHSAVLALLEPRIRGARCLDAGADGHGSAVAGRHTRVNTD